MKAAFFCFRTELIKYTNKIFYDNNKGAISDLKNIIYRNKEDAEWILQNR